MSFMGDQDLGRDANYDGSWSRQAKTVWFGVLLVIVSAVALIVL